MRASGGRGDRGAGRTAAGTRGPLGALFESLRRDDSGQDLIEYVLLALLIGVATAVALGALSDSAATGFDNASDALVTP